MEKVNDRSKHKINRVKFTVKSSTKTQILNPKYVIIDFSHRLFRNKSGAKIFLYLLIKDCSI